MTITDPAGGLVASVGTLTLRPLTAEPRPGSAPAPLAVEWRTLPPTEEPGGYADMQMAVLGDPLPHITAPRHATIEALAADDEVPPPDAVLMAAHSGAATAGRSATPSYGPPSVSGNGSSTTGRPQSGSPW